MTTLFPAVVTVLNAELALLVLEQIFFQGNTSSKTAFFIQTWKTPFKKIKQLQLTSAAINHTVPV